MSVTLLPIGPRRWLPRLRWRHIAASALAAYLLLHLGATPLHASGDGIRVTSSWVKVEFPSGLDLMVTASNDQPIVEVKLVYRSSNDGKWDYAYPDFSPGRRITATFSLSTAGESYLPPGTELGYYYIMRDAAGEIHQTGPTTIEYSDTRFQWERTRSGPLVLLHHDIPHSEVAQALRRAEDGLRRLNDLLPAAHAQPIKGVIYNQRAEALEAFPPWVRTPSKERAYQGFAFPPQGVFLGIGLEPQLIVHEAAHLWLQQALGPDALPLPAWLDEGIAGYVAPGSKAYSGERLSPHSSPLQDMYLAPSNSMAIGAFYKKAESVVAYLVEDRGVESFRQFLGALSGGVTVSQALEDIYGVDTDGLDAQWAISDRGPPAPSPISPHQSFASWPTAAVLAGGFLFLFLGAVVIPLVAYYFQHRTRPITNS